LLQQKVAKKVAISLGYFVFSKYHKEPPKVAQLAKSGHPDSGLFFTEALGAAKFIIIIAMYLATLCCAT
jgi:hypothetical protein